MEPLFPTLLLASFLGLAVAYNNGLGALPPMGWNTWCTDDVCGLLDICTESEVHSIADAIVAQGLDKLGYTYVNLDDCWSATTRAADGSLQPNAAQFPSGMKALADYVHSKGLKLGLYTDVGTETCRGGRPGAYGHYEQDAQTLASWGVDFIKADNCHRAADGIESYTNYSRAVNATGRPILFSLCNWGDENVLEWGPSLGQMYRFQMDHLPLWTWPPLAAGEGFGQGTVNIIEYMATVHPSQHSGPYGYIDPDFLETLFLSLPFTESRTEYSFWSLWSAPLIIATDIRNMSAEFASIVTNPEVIAVDQDVAGIAGERMFNGTDGAQVWVKPLHKGDRAVILFNSGDTATITVSVTWDMLGWTLGDTVLVRDLWNRENVGSFQTGYNATVKPHDVFYFYASIVA